VDTVICISHLWIRIGGAGDLHVAGGCEGLDTLVQVVPGTGQQRDSGVLFIRFGWKGHAHGPDRRHISHIPDLSVHMCPGFWRHVRFTRIRDTLCGSLDRPDGNLVRAPDFCEGVTGLDAIVSR